MTRQEYQEKMRDLFAQWDGHKALCLRCPNANLQHFYFLSPVDAREYGICAVGREIVNRIVDLLQLAREGQVTA